MEQLHSLVDAVQFLNKIKSSNLKSAEQILVDKIWTISRGLPIMPA